MLPHRPGEGRRSSWSSLGLLGALLLWMHNTEFPRRLQYAAQWSRGGFGGEMYLIVFPAQLFMGL